jgi:hypothetical protein
MNSPWAWSWVAFWIAARPWKVLERLQRPKVSTAPLRRPAA